MGESFHRAIGAIFVIFGIWIIFYVLSNELVIYYFSISGITSHFIWPLVMVECSVVLVVCGLVLVVFGGGDLLAFLSLYLFGFLLICYLIFMFTTVARISSGY